MTSGLEVDLLEDFEFACADDDQLSVLTTVILHGTWLIWAVVHTVGNAVAVAIRVGATIVLQRAGFVRTLVVDIQDAVAIVVRIWATVLVLEAVDIFGVNRATVVDIEHTVAVVVQVRTTVLILESVEVLSLVRTLVDVIQYSVAVGIADDLRLRHREANHGDAAPVRCAVAGGHTGATRHTHHKPLRMQVFEAPEHLDRRFFAAPERNGAVGRGPAEAFHRDHELVLAKHEQEATAEGELVADEKIGSDELALRAELIPRLNRNSNDVARIEGQQELEPAAEVRRLVDLAGPPLLVIGERSGVDRHGRLQRNFDHVLARAVQVAARTKVDVAEVSPIREQIVKAPTGRKTRGCTLPRIDDEVVGNIHVDHEAVPQAQVPVEVARQLPMHHGGTRPTGAGLLEDQRIVVVVHVDHEPETLMALAVGGAARKTVGRQLSRPVLIQVDLRRALRGRSRRRPEDAYDHG